MLLGAHVSAAGQPWRAFARAAAIGAECLQIFTRAPGQWRLPELQDPQEFRLRHRQAGSPPLFAHDIYLSNLAAADDTVRKRSIASQIAEMHRCSRFGVAGLVCHMGSHPDTQVGLDRLSRGIAEVLQASPPDVQMLLETCAGQGNTLGHRFEHLAYCIERNPALGVCLDTCHIWVAGYPLASPEGYQTTWQHFDRLIGIERLKLLHLNDTSKACGSRVDRHAHIGQGQLGDETFRRLLSDPRLAHLPAVLETPESELMHAVNLARLRGLAQPLEPDLPPTRAGVLLPSPG